jgi:hypothetical protein
VTLLSACAFQLLALFGFSGASGALTISDSTLVGVAGEFRDAPVYVPLGTSPNIALALTAPRAQFSIGYLPRIAFTDLGGDDRAPLVLHSAAAWLTTHGQRWSLAAGQSLSIGRQNNTYLMPLPSRDPTAPADPAAAAGPVTPPLPTDPAAPVGIPQTDLRPNTAVRLLGEQSTLSGTYQWSVRLRSVVQVAYGISGGRGASSEAVLPAQHTASASTGLDYALSPAAALRSSAAFMYTDLSNGYTHRVLTLSETWTRRWAPLTTTSAAAGAALQVSDDPAGQREDRILPVAMLGINHRVVRRGTLLALSGVTATAPRIVSITGRMEPALLFGGGFSVVHERSVLGLSGDLTQTVPVDADAVTVFGGGLLFNQWIADWFGLGAGSRVQYQRLRGSDLELPPVWSLFVLAVVAAPAWRF